MNTAQRRAEAVRLLVQVILQRDQHLSPSAVLKGVWMDVMQGVRAEEGDTQ